MLPDVNKSNFSYENVCLTIDTEFSFLSKEMRDKLKTLLRKTISDSYYRGKQEQL